ncbi:translation initiation factor 2 [Streptomyces sp. NPDC002734]|uniref:translation initiation factor 2 n=1 Tax=Streptomyces sp. NPDC002734 TaxID=3154426 RepID=UPI00332D0ED2
MAQRDRFVVAHLVTDCHIFEGDGTRPIDEENVQIIYEPDLRRVDLPVEVQQWRQDIKADMERREAAGEPYAWNNPRFAVESIIVSRTNETEEPLVRMSLCDADYYDFLATSVNLDRPLREGDPATLRSQYLDSADPVTAPAFLSCSFGVNVAVETADRRMVFARRSTTVQGHNKVRWNSSVNEGLAAIHDVPEDGSPISLHSVARRALREELAVQDEDKVELELLAFALDLRNHQWAAFYRAVLPELTADTLVARRSRGIEDKWEHDRFDFVPADPDSVLDFILQKDPEAWTPCGPALFYMALVRAAVVARGGDRSGRLDVEAAERRAVDRLKALTTATVAE